MLVVIPGGTGHVGALLVRELRARGHRTVVLSRRGDANNGVLEWDGKTLGDWASSIDGADVVINLAGRTVNCRYSDENLKQMLDSRVDSTRVVGEAIAAAGQPPAVWLQMSTATIYAHHFDTANDEATGIIGGDEPDVPAYWKTSIDIAKAWEQTQLEALTPDTRRVALRTAMVMSPDPDGIFGVLSKLTRSGLGGAVGGGQQYVSWIHERDFFNAVMRLIDDDSANGPVNLAAPNPLPQREFMAELRRAWGRGIGLPATKWMAEIGAFFMRTDTELILKSRRVVPGRLLEMGFEFEFPDWGKAADELVTRLRAKG